jgi:Domain of unknown function (DUF4190)
MAIRTPERTVDRSEPVEAPVAASPVDAHASPVAERRGRSGQATTSMVLGIIGVIASIIPIAAWVLGGVALGLGLSARSQIRRYGLAGSGQATSGIILGIIAIVAGIGFAVINVAMMN